MRLLGYADKPKLVIMQEILYGDSIDKQLYVEVRDIPPAQLPGGDAWTRSRI